jgi:hypothetical protein
VSNVTVLRDVEILVNDVDLSDQCNNVTIEDTADAVDVTTFQGNGYKQNAVGLKDATATATFFQNFSTGSVHDTLSPLYSSGDTFDIKIKGTNAATGTSNPQIVMTVRLFSYRPIGGGVGEASSIEASFQNAGAGISYVTT